MTAEEETMSDVENCRGCEKEFMKRPMLQAKVAHERNVFGDNAAIAMLRDELESEHEAHAQEDGDGR